MAEFCFGRLLQAVDAQLCLPGQLPAHGIHRILVLRPNHRLGNAVLTTPLLNEIEIIYPGAEIDLVSAGHAAESLFRGRFQVRRVFCLPHRIARHPLSALACLHALRATRYDLVIDPCVASNTARLLLGACKARYKVGFISDTPSAAPDRSCPGLPDHLAKRGVHALRAALGDTTQTQWPPLEMRLAVAEWQQGRRALDNILGGRTLIHNDARPVIGMFANATGNKRLPETWWSELIDRLTSARPDICIVEVLAAHGHSQLPGTTFSFYTRDLRKLAAVLANMQGFVSADCGVMHLAAAVGTPTLGLFTRPNRAKYTPYSNGNAGLDVSVGEDEPCDQNGTSAHQSVLSWVRQITMPNTDSDTHVSMGCNTSPAHHSAAPGHPH